MTNKDLLKVISESDKYHKYREKYFSLETIPEDEYFSLHKNPIQSLGIKVDLDLFNSQVEMVKDHFQPWGIKKHISNRYGIALTKQQFQTDVYPAPPNWPSDTWSLMHPNRPLMDPDFTVRTNWFHHFTSLQPVYDAFDNSICRANITWWNEGGQFTPHVDISTKYAHNFRIWMSNKTAEAHKLMFDNGNGKLVNLSHDLNPGEVYLIDTSIVHHGIATEDNVFSMLFSILPSGTETIKELVGFHE